MGRKNRNASSRRYTTYSELKNSTVHFDLSKGTFLAKTRVRTTTSNENVDLNVTITKGKNSQTRALCFSFKSDVAQTMIKGAGRYWICGIVEEEGVRRLYFVPDEYGYALCENAHGKRQYLKLPLESDEESFSEFAGKHSIMFDNFNKAYYVTANE